MGKFFDSIQNILDGIDCNEPTFTVEDFFFLDEINNRKLYLSAEIDSDTVEGICRLILRYNSEDKYIAPEERQPIYLYITSIGGCIDDGFKLIDIIQMSKTPVYTVNLGYQYSMGFLIGIAGHKRFATQNAKFLLHDGTNYLWDSGAKVQDRMKFSAKLDARIRQFVLSKTNISEKEYNENFRVEWYMFADEAKQLGVVDYIIGDDECDIDYIV